MRSLPPARPKRAGLLTASKLGSANPANPPVGASTIAVAAAVTGVGRTIATVTGATGRGATRSGGTTGSTAGGTTGSAAAVVPGLAEPARGGSRSVARIASSSRSGATV